MTLDPVTRRLIWERFERDKPNPGPAFSDWAASFSEESGVPERDIRRVAAEGSAVILTAINAKAITLAQDIAERMGANLSSAFAVLREAYTATKKKVLMDKSGRPKLIAPELGFVPTNMIYIEVEDWQARLAAVRTTIEIFGARAPQEIEVRGQVKGQFTNINIDIPLDQAMAELKRLPGEIDRLYRAYAEFAEADAASGSPGSSGTGKTIEVRPIN